MGTKRDIEEEMSKTLVNTKDGNFTLLELVKKGVKNKVKYYNLVEKKAPREIRSIQNPTVIEEVTHDYGIIFSDGFEIRNVEVAVFKKIEAEIILKRERKW